MLATSIKLHLQLLIAASLVLQTWAHGQRLPADPSQHKVGDLASIFSEWAPLAPAQSQQLQLQQQQPKQPQQQPHQNRSASAYKPELPFSIAEMEQLNRNRKREPIVVTSNSQFGGPNSERIRQEMRERPRRLAELGPGDEVSRWLFGYLEPRWMDACARRPARNETLLVIKLNEPAIYHSPAALEQDKRERGNFIRAVARRRGLTLSPLAQHELDLISAEMAASTTPSPRLKRSLGAGKWTRPPQAPLLLLRRQPAGLSSKRARTWPAKKTTFSLSSLPRFQLARGRQRFIVAPSGAGPESALGPPASGADRDSPLEQQAQQQQQREDKQLQDLVLELFQLDIKVSWHVSGTLNTLNYLKDSLAALQGALAKVVTTARATVEPAPDAAGWRQRAQEIRTAHRKWLPQLDELVRPADGSSARAGAAREAGLFNFTAGGLNGARQRALMYNMSQHLEFFDVALEQMKYDQANLSGLAAPAPAVERALYENLDRHLLKVLCESEFALAASADFQQRRAAFERLRASLRRPANIAADLRGFYERLSRRQLSRDHAHTGARLESPVELAFGKLEPREQAELLRRMAGYSPEMRARLESDQQQQQKQQQGGRDAHHPAPHPAPLQAPKHIWREIMPLEQRQLFEPLERAIRDEAILDDLAPLVQSYESLLLSNFA